jgi:polyhydroxybutyrate depolymerase
MKAAAIAALLITVGCAGQAGPSSVAARSSPSPSPTRIGYLTFGGLQRVYVLFRPPQLSTGKSVPLVIAMHGFTVDTTWMEDTSRFDDLAARSGFVVVYPQGTGDSWNAGRCCGHNSNDDVGFIKALIDKLIGEQNIDPKRVFATGMSNGGFMAQRLACEAADHIAAAASVSGALVIDTCTPSRAVSVIEMHGIDDDLVPINGGNVAGLTFYPAAMANMQSWASRDGCAAKPTTANDGSTTTYTWSVCRDNATVVLKTIAGGGHSWFSPSDGPGIPDATQVVWDFFSQAPPLP